MTDDLKGLTAQQVREERLKMEREFYLDPTNFVDYLRDFGAAPDAEEEPHGVGANWIMNWKVREVDEESGNPYYYHKMCLWPRNSFKSHCFDVGLTSWLIAKNPNERILVASETARQAGIFVGLAMKIIDSPKYREVFGGHRGRKWYEQKGFFSELRTEFEKEMTLQATGCGEVQTGMHYTWVIGDDIVSQENTKTAEAMETTRSWLAETMAQLDPGCHLLLIGTRHHFADIYGWILKNPDPRSLFEFSIHKWRNPDGSLFFKQRLTEKYVMAQKKIMPPRQWSAYYENQPHSEEDQLFLKEYFRTIPDEDIPKNCWTYIFTDFAFKTSEHNDRTVFWVVSIDTHRVAYVRELLIGRWKPSRSCRLLIETWNNNLDHEIKGVAVEDTTHKELLSDLLEEIRRETHTRPKIIPIPGRSQEIKNMRIEGVEPRFRRGDIYFAESIRQNYKIWTFLTEEMTEWPFSDHDDIPDAISDIDKKDKKGRFLIKAPPVGWGPHYQSQHIPPYVNGHLNPELALDPRGMLKSQGRSGSLWEKQPGGGEVNGDLWGKKAPQPGWLQKGYE
jgi:hypothetical protein